MTGQEWPVGLSDSKPKQSSVYSSLGISDV